MTVRFNCLINAESLPDAWGKLEEVCAGLYYGYRSFDDEFMATVIEKSEENERGMTMGELIKRMKNEASMFGKELEAEVYAIDHDGYMQIPKVETCYCTRGGKSHKVLMICGEDD